MVCNLHVILGKRNNNDRLLRQRVIIALLILLLLLLKDVFYFWQWLGWMITQKMMSPSGSILTTAVGLLSVAIWLHLGVRLN